MLKINMNRNKHGYKTIEQHTYEIEVNESTYFVEVDVTLFIKPPDYSTWDSDYDYYGYTEGEYFMAICFLLQKYI